MKDIIVQDFIRKKITTEYHKTDQTLLAWIEEDGILYNLNKGFLRGEAYRAHFLRTSEAIKKFNARKLLTDSVELQIVPVEDQLWTAQTGLELLAKTTLRHSAYVIPASIFAQLSVDKIQADTAVTTYENRPFGDVREAWEWLKSVK